MATEQSRIIDFEETSTVNSDDYVLVDGNTAGTRKYNINSISGSIPESYAGLTTLLEDENLVADTVNNTLIGNFTTGYPKDIFRLNQQGERITWGDTDAEELSSAFNSLCGRVATIEHDGGLPDFYSGLTTLLYNEYLVPDTEQNTLVGDFTTGYLQDIYRLDDASERIPWGDTEVTALSDAINDICNRLATVETGGVLPASYAGLTAMLENDDIRFEEESGPVTLALTGYHMRLDVSTAHVYDSTGWGDTQDTDLGVAIGNICSRIETLEDGGTLRSLTELVEEGYIEFDNQSTPYEMSFDNANIHLNTSGDILRTGYWAEGVSDSSSLVQALSEIATYVSNESDELDELTETVSGVSSTVDNLSSDLSRLSGDVDTVSGTVDTLSSDVSNLQSMLSGFVDNDVSFDEVNNLCINNVNLKLASENADILTGYWTYWGSYVDEQTQQDMPGTSTNSLIAAFQYVCGKLDEYEARITALENGNA